MRLAAVSFVLLLACGGSKKSNDNCELRKNDAASAVAGALSSVARAHQEAKATYDEVKTAHDHVQAGQDELEQRMKLFEQSMDCLVKVDCCKRLAAMNTEQKTQVWSMHSKIFETSLPHEIDAIAAPLRARADAAEDLATAKPAEAEAFCTGARADIAKLRGVDGAAAWKVARDALTADLAKAKREYDDAKRRDDELGAWANAIAKKTKATTTPDLASAEYNKARNAVNVYNDVCF